MGVTLPLARYLRLGVLVRSWRDVIPWAYFDDCLTQQERVSVALCLDLGEWVSRFHCLVIASWVSSNG